MLLFYAKLWLFWFLSQSKSEGMQLRWKWYNNFHYRQEVSNFSAQCHWMSHPSDRFKGFLETFLKYEVPRFLLKIRRKPIGSALIWRRRNKSTLAPVYPFWACMGHECHLGNLSSAIAGLGILTVKFGFLLCATDKIVYIRQMSKIFQQRVLLRPTGCILSQKLHESFHKCWTKHSPAQTLHLASITKGQSPWKLLIFNFGGFISLNFTVTALRTIVLQFVVKLEVEDGIIDFFSMKVNVMVAHEISLHFTKQLSKNGNR